MEAIEQKIVEALSPGAFIRDGEAFTFASLLESVKAEIDALVEVDGGAKTAATLYETFAAACVAKADANEVDDSSGSFGEFVRSLLLSCMRAQQRAGVPAADVVRKMRRWIDRDDYGFCSRLEEEAHSALDADGKRELERALIERLETATGENAEWQKRSALFSLKALAEAQGDLEKFVAFCERATLTSQDCLRVARLCDARGDADRALEWVERGRGINDRSGASYDLGKLRRALLLRLGRAQEVIDEAWRDYEAHPSGYGYEDLIKLLPVAEHAACRQRAIDFIVGKSIGTVMDVCVATEEPTLLADGVLKATEGQLQAIGHSLGERAAILVASTSPLAAARILVAQAQRILRAGKSRYYDSAMEYVYRASQCYAACGAEDEWAKVAVEIRHEHRRKGFVVDFDKLLAGKWPEKKESFLEAAKRSWLEG